MELLANLFYVTSFVAFDCINLKLKYIQWSSRNSKSHFAEICLLIGELAIRGTELTLNARLGTENNLLIEQYY